MTLREYAVFFLNKINMDTAEMPDFLAACDTLTGEYAEDFAALAGLYRETVDHKVCAALRKSLSEKSGVHPYTLDAVMLVDASKWLKDSFIEKGYTEDDFWNIMTDFRCKFIECKKVMHVEGTFVIEWYDEIFRVKIFRLGRFEYEKRIYSRDEPLTVDGYTVGKGDAVYYIHIPSDGPMPAEARADSYRQAAKFFAKEQNGKPVILFCSSWLMYPENDKIFSPTSNIVGFLHEFDTIEVVIDKSYGAAWWLFDRFYNGNPDELPTDTSARRAMVAYLKKGGITGGAEAVFKKALFPDTVI